MVWLSERRREREGVHRVKKGKSKVIKIEWSRLRMREGKVT